MAVPAHPAIFGQMRHCDSNVDPVSTSASTNGSFAETQRATLLPASGRHCAFVCGNGKGFIGCNGVGMSSCVGSILSQSRAPRPSTSEIKSSGRS